MDPFQIIWYITEHEQQAIVPVILFVVLYIAKTMYTISTNHLKHATDSLHSIDKGVEKLGDKLDDNFREIRGLIRK